MTISGNIRILGGIDRHWGGSNFEKFVLSKTIKNYFLKISFKLSTKLSTFLKQDLKT